MCALTAAPTARHLDPTAATLQHPGVTVHLSADGRRELGLDLGRLGLVTVVESPAPVLTDLEWRRIVEARTSYQRMWGGDQQFQSIKEDAFDGRGPSARWYRTTHYIGSITTPGKPDKLLTLRKVALNQDSLACGGAAPPLPDDLSFWLVRDIQHGVDTPLAEWLKAYLETELRLGPFPSAAHLPIAALSRGGTLPYEAGGPRHRDDRNRSAVVWALMQVAVALDDRDNVLYAAQPCEEFRTRVFALQLPDGNRIEPHYVPAAETLPLPCERYRVVLDRTNASVRQTMCSFPGFWLDNPSFANVLVALVRERLLTADNLRQAAVRLYRSGDVAYLADDQAMLVDGFAHGVQCVMDELEAFAALLARPRFAKYTTDLIRQRADVSRRILAEVADGPYGAVFRPADLLARSLHLLCVAAELYR